MDTRDSTIVRFAQLNTARSFAWTTEAELIMKENALEIMALQEPYSNRGKIHVSNAIYDSGCGNPLSCVISANNSRAMLITSLSDQYFTTISYTIGVTELYIVSAYFKYDQSSVDLTEGLRSILKSLTGKQIIICGDFNAKSKWWFSTATDESGELLQELIIEQNLTIHNTPQVLTTFENVHGKSNIDITLSRNLGNRIVDWKVNDLSSSDHRLITFSLDLGVIQTPRTDAKFVLRGANWSKFDTTFRRELSHLNRLTIDSKADIDSFARELTTSLVIASQVALKKKEGKPKNSFKLTDEAIRLRTKMRWCRYRANKDKTVESISEYRQARNAYKSEIRKIKHSNFRDFIVKHGDDPWGPSYKALKVRPSANSVSVLNPITLREEYCCQDNINIILDTLFPSDDPAEDTTEQAELRSLAYLPSQEADDPPFTMEEIKSVITRMKKGRAAGPDGILPEVLQRSIPSSLAILERLFNACLREKYFPSDWKLARVILLRKDEAGRTAKSYRPISLLSVVSKALEGVLIERILNKVSDKLCPTQYGFTPGKSTTDAIKAVLHTVDSISSKYVVLICLDISGAFDNAWWPSIAEQLRGFNCPGNLYGLLGQFFNSRAIKYETSEFAIHRMIERGCPQGSKAGPRCWNILMDSLLRQFDNRDSNVKLIAYADDTALIVGADSRTELERKVNPLLQEIVEWGHKRKLMFNSSKTECILLRGFRKRNPTIIMSGTSLRFKPQVKYLGMILDSKLTFKPHARYIADKAVKKFAVFRAIARKDFGIKTGVLRLLYKGIFESVISYGSGVLIQRLDSTLEKILVTAQRKALLLVTKAYSTTPNEALTIIGGVMPVAQLIKYRAAIMDKDIDRPTIRSNIIAEWKNEWCNSTKCRVLYEALPNPAVVLNLRMEFGHEQVQFLTEHGGSRSYLHKYFPNRYASDTCQCGVERQDFRHLLFVCRIFVEERSAMVGYCYQRHIAWPPSVTQLLVDKELCALFKTYASSVCYSLTRMNRQ